MICFAYAIGQASGLGCGGAGADKVKEEGAGFAVEPVYDEFWEKEDDDVECALEHDEEKTEEEGDILVRAQTRKKRQVRHGRELPVIHVFGSWPWPWPVRPLFYGSLAPSTRSIFPPALSMMRSTRAPSPTLTAFSGISSYRTDSYKPLRDKSSTSTPPLDPHQVARTHYDELSKYLSSYLAKGSMSSLSPFAHSHVHPPTEPANSRSTARQKLTRLTRQQFQELSTDVYDELIRRKTNSDNIQGPSSVSPRTSNSPVALVPFLPVRDEFHPKRNQARQKLATLPMSRFKDLSSDVYYELVRRYPEFKEEVRLVYSPSMTLFLPSLPSSSLLLTPL